MFSNISVTESKFDDKVHRLTHWLADWLACWTLIVIMMNISQIKNVCQSAVGPAPPPPPPYIISAHIPVRWFTFILQSLWCLWCRVNIQIISPHRPHCSDWNSILLNMPDLSSNTTFPGVIPMRFVKTIREQILSIYTASQTGNCK